MMRNLDTYKRFASGFAIAAMVAACLPAQAWGPRTDAAITLAAMRIVSRDSGLPMEGLRAEVREGAEIPLADLYELIPNADIAPIPAIEAEIELLQQVRGRSVDPYFAYRLGVLGKLVAQVTSPMTQAEQRWQKIFYADTEATTSGLNLVPQDRRAVDSQSYLRSVVAEANAQNDVIVEEYESGIGFDGIARASSAKNISRSIHAVADVWYTILSRESAVGLAETQTREYIVGGLDFYISRGNSREIERAYEKLSQLAYISPALRERIGTMFFDAGRFERAVAEYEQVLREEPSRSEVAVRLSNHYIDVGDDAVDDGRLEDALEAYTKAVEYNKSEEAAHLKLAKAETLIRERSARMAASEGAITEAEELQEEAEMLVINGRTADAVALLYEAQMLYSTITSEFPQFASAARVGTANVSSRISQLQQRLTEDVAMLSGTGIDAAVREEAHEAALNNSIEILKALRGAYFSKELARIQADLADNLRTPSR